MKIRQQLYNKPHPDLAHSLYSIGSILLDLGQPEEALKSFQEALKILLSLYDKNHSDVAKSLLSIGAALQALRKTDKALEHHEQTLQLFISSLGPLHPLIKVLKNDIKNLNRASFFYNILIKIKRFFLAIRRFFTT